MSNRLLASISSFLGILPFLLFGGCFFLSPFYLNLFVCFHILDSSAMTPYLCGVVSCQESCRTQWFSPLFSWAECSSNAPYAVYVSCPIVFGYWLLLACFLVGSCFCLADWEVRSPPCLLCCYTGADRILVLAKPNNTEKQINSTTKTAKSMIKEQRIIE